MLDFSSLGLSDWLIQQCKPNQKLSDDPYGIFCLVLTPTMLDCQTVQSPGKTNGLAGPHHSTPGRPHSDLQHIQHQEDPNVTSRSKQNVCLGATYLNWKYFSHRVRTAEELDQKVHPDARERCLPGASDPEVKTSMTTGPS
uniref:Uncharacterized protein n=1 Tax=Oncorhynchus mykiss TaxID=8022 RepID=A0A8L0DKN2_ONCMY